MAVSRRGTGTRPLLGSHFGRTWARRGFHRVRRVCMTQWSAVRECGQGGVDRIAVEGLWVELCAAQLAGLLVAPAFAGAQRFQGVLIAPGAAAVLGWAGPLARAAPWVDRASAGPGDDLRGSGSRPRSPERDPSRQVAMSSVSVTCRDHLVSRDRVPVLWDGSGEGCVWCVGSGSRKS